MLVYSQLFAVVWLLRKMKLKGAEIDFVPWVHCSKCSKYESLEKLCNESSRCLTCLKFAIIGKIKVVSSKRY